MDLKLFFLIYLPCTICSPFLDGLTLEDVKKKETLDNLLKILEVKPRPTSAYEWSCAFTEASEKYSEKNDASEFSTFLAYTRAKAEELCANRLDVPDNATYSRLIKEKFKDDPNPPELRPGKYYRAWTLMLHEAKENDPKQLKKLRQLLKNDRKKYHEFAMRMHQVRSIAFFEDQARMKLLTYFDKRKIEDHIFEMTRQIKIVVANIICSDEEDCKV